MTPLTSQPRPNPRICVYSVGSDGWNLASTVVSESFQRKFNARVRPNPDIFITYERFDYDRNDHQISACCGVTFAESRSLFSEQYLDESVDDMLTQQLGRPVYRDQVIEVGSIAASAATDGHELLKSLPIVCWSMGRRYVLCTATRQLALMFRRVGIDFTRVGKADVRRLSAGDADWGLYYDCDPSVGFIRLAASSQIFEQNTGRLVFDWKSIVIQDVSDAAALLNAS